MTVFICHKPSAFAFIVYLIFTEGFFIHILIDDRPQFMKINIYEPEKIAMKFVQWIPFLMFETLNSCRRKARLR